MSEQNSQNKDKVRIDFPPKWVTTEKANGEPYTISNGKGESWPAVKCTLPTGTKVDGKDLSGFNFTTFQKPWNKVDIEAGKGTGVFVNADRNVSLFKYDQDGQRHDESVDPQKLSDAVEAARAEYRAQHQDHDRSQEQETSLDDLCEQKTAEASELADGITFNAELEMEKIDCVRGEQSLDDICDAKSEEADLVADTAMGEREAPDNEQDK